MPIPSARCYSSVKPHRFWRLPALGLLALLIAGCEEQSAPQGGDSAPPRPEVSVVTLHPQSAAITAELPGRISASQLAEVRPQVNGIIQERLFQEGSEVTAGTVLYQIDPASYQAAYDSAVAAQQKAEAAVPTAQAKVNRLQTLFKQRVVSQQDLDDALAALAQAKAEVAGAKASVESARISLAYTKITAPITGRIGKSSLTPGALVTASQETALTIIRKLDPINVDVTESSTKLLDFRQAIAEGRVKLSGPDIAVKLKLDNGTIYPHAGRIEFSEANVEQATSTFSLRAEFPNPDRLLLPGMYVRAIIEGAVAEASFVVPQRAVTRNPKGEATALVVTADGKVEERILTVRNSIGNNWLVDKGLNDGDRVIVEGLQLVRAGQDATAIEVTIDELTGEIKERQESSLSGTSALFAHDLSGKPVRWPGQARPQAFPDHALAKN